MTITEIDVVRACQTLFGKEINISRDFLFYMQPSGVKSAYRRKAKETHPDLYAADPLDIQQKQTVLFREVLGAYDVLSLFFKQREEGGWKHVKARPAAPIRPRTERRTKSRPESASSGKGDETYYHGSVPFRRLQVGQYLYYRGMISFGALIDALVWQRKQRPTIGDIAIRWGWLDSERIKKLFAATDMPRRFGEKAVELGFLTVFQVNTILMYQRTQQIRLGNYFIEKAILTTEQLDQLVRDLHEHNAAVFTRIKPSKDRRPSFV